MISKKHLSLFFLLMVNLCVAQKETWTLDPENSFISYDAKHILHSWKGMNTNVKGIAKVEANKINQIAILTLVKDFDSNNSGRDAHALEVLQSLSYPEVRFYSDSITVAQDSIKITGLFNFHGVNQSRSIAALIENEKNKKIIRGSFKLTPSDFDIKLPSLMMVKMENLLLFNFKLEFIK
ncbi:MAG: YceI family protein [Flavobacteriaceae bacterium]|nr:YceI family protein [Flavobacteriaceae bacterium]MDG2503028.1 YceI family protein [Flavobacteriaceae bacterium]